MKFIKKFTLWLIPIMALLMLTGCIDGKSPEKGYVSIEKIDNVIASFEEYEVLKYQTTGSFNYFGITDPKKFPTPSVDSTTLFEYNYSNPITKEEIDYKKEYNIKCSSYYLRVPLYITVDNWKTDKLDANRMPLNTKYRLEDKIYRTADGNDNIYYYLTEDGGFKVKAFGVNKKLIIYPNTYQSVECNAKWNVEIVYDKYGYLVSESFATLNKGKNNDSECCYGQATYTYTAK